MTPQTQRLFLALALVVLLCPLACGVDGAPAAVPAREYLDQAKAAAFEIPLPGDQSAAFLEISLALVDTDPAAALDLAARMRRTFDSARALGAAAVAISPSDPVGAVEHVLTAGRLLLGITDPDQRLAEQRLLLREVAPLGEAALPAGPELSPGEAQLAVVLARAESDPTAALVSLRKWQLRDAAYDRAAALIADRMAVAQPEEALALAATVLSSSGRLPSRVLSRTGSFSRIVRRITSKPDCISSLASNGVRPTSSS